MDDTTPAPEYGGYRLASLIQLERNGACWTLYVDGHKFPYLVGRVVDARLDPDEIPSVSVELLADHVQIDNGFRRGDRHPQAWSTAEAPTAAPADGPADGPPGSA